MHTVTAPVRKSKNPRFVNLAQPFGADGTNAVLSIREIVGKRDPKEVTDEYFLDRVPSDFGEAFLIEKREYNPNAAEDSRYHVLLATGPEEGGHSCECRGFLRHDHCRHIEALIALRKADKI